MIFKLQTRIAYCATVSAAALSFTMPAAALEQDAERTLLCGSKQLLWQAFGRVRL